MPVYGTNVAPAIPALTTSQPVTLFNRELVTAGTQSIQVVLPPNEVAPRSYSVEVSFTDASGNPSNPGTFEIDLLHADTDVATKYVTAFVLNKGLNASYVGRVEMVNVVTKFVSVVLASVQNSVYLTVNITK